MVPACQRSATGFSLLNTHIASVTRLILIGIRVASVRASDNSDCQNCTGTLVEPSKST
jgi:hypothetical protein